MLVSVIMPSYQTERFIRDAIQSVLNQTLTDWELIIVDDCSYDQTEQAVRQFRDSRIVYIKNDKNGGAGSCRNIALQRASGKYIAFLDSDDVWLPQKLEKQIAFMEKNGYAFTYTAYTEIDAAGNSLHRLVRGPKRVGVRQMQQYDWCGCLTVMYAREQIGTLQIYPIRKNNDYALWLAAIQKRDLYFLDEPLAQYRRRTNSVSSGKKLALVRWHYRLWRLCMKKGRVASMWFTLQNIAFGLYKKIRFVGSDI